MVPISSPGSVTSTELRCGDCRHRRQHVDELDASSVAHRGSETVMNETRRRKFESCRPSQPVRSLWAMSELHCVTWAWGRLSFSKSPGVDWRFRALRSWS
jgi:hypothetical protein